MKREHTTRLVSNVETRLLRLTLKENVVIIMEQLDQVLLMVPKVSICYQTETELQTQNSPLCLCLYK